MKLILILYLPKNEFKISTFYFWFFVRGRAVTMGIKVIVAHSMHNFVPVIPLQTWDGTRKFHRMIITINCKRTACILIFMCSFGDKCKWVFNPAKRCYGSRLSNVFINQTENYISWYFFTFRLELLSYYLSILIFSTLISPIERIIFKFIKEFY